MCTAESLSSADNAAPVPPKPRRRRNNRAGRGGNKRTSLPHPPAVSQPEDWSPRSDSGGTGPLENGVVDGSNTSDGAAAPRHNPAETEAAAMTPKH